MTEMFWVVVAVIGGIAACALSELVQGLEQADEAASEDAGLAG